MRKLKILLSAMVLCLLCISCSYTKEITVLPKAINTMNVAPLSDLNLTSNDYKIYDTITAEATVAVVYRKNRTYLSEENGEFFIQYDYDKYGNASIKYNGICKLGYFGSDYDSSTNFLNPEEVVRRFAIYRAINLASEQGADAFIEPTISTNIQQNGNKVMYKSTVTAKLIRINTNE